MVAVRNYADSSYSLLIIICIIKYYWYTTMYTYSFHNITAHNIIWHS